MSEITNTATIRVVADASGVEAGLRPAVEAARRTEQAVAQVGNGAATSARNVETAQRNIIGSIQRTTVAMEAGGRATSQYYELLARQRGVDPGAVAPYINALRSVEQAQVRTGQSAGQTAQALRMVPAQLTDIVTSLQGGQAPLTVFLQQGGQLRDQFGSAGAAARALGGYIMGLINPYTVAAAAAVALAVAYKAGAEEASAYAKAIALSGNAAGTTVNQLSDAARQIAAVSGTQGAAAEALNALVATGQVPAENLKQFAAVAVDAQRVIGKSVADTAAEFAELGRAPLTALDKINEKYHFITSATYAQVKALQDQGKAAEAADVAQKAYADGIDKQRQKVLDSLTDWERGWIRIKGAISGAVDGVLDFAGGREATGMQKINSLLDERSKIEENLARARARNLPADVAAYEAELEVNKRSINAIRDKEGATKAAAKAEGDAAQIAEARNKWLSEGDKYLTRAAQLERDVTKARNEGAAAHLSQTDIDKRVSDIQKSYADIFNAGIDSNIAALKRRDQVRDVLEQRELARIQAQRGAGSMTEDDAINATANAELAAFTRKRALLEAEIAQTKLKANSIKEVADLQGQIEVLDAQRASRAIQRTNDLFAAEQKRYRQAVDNSANVIEREMAELASLKQQTQAQLDYNDAIGLSQVQIAGLTAARMLDAAARKDSEADIAEGLDLTGERAENIRKEAAAIRERAAALMEGAAKQERYTQWKQAIDQYGQVFQQGFADMLNNGQAGWKSFTHSLVTTFKTSVADQIYKMFARPLVVQMVGSFMGISGQAIAGEIASGSAGSAGGGSSLIGGAQSAASLYSAFSGGLNGAVGNAISSAGNLFGSSAVSAFGSGLANGAAVGDAASAYAAAGQTGVSSALSAGASIAPAIPIIAATIASYFIAKGIAGQYKVEGIGTALNYLGIAGGLINRAFGMGDKQVTGQGVSGTLSASSLTGQNYANWHQDGGWFRSDRDGKDTTALTADIVKQFTQGLSAIESASSGFAQSLGVQADWIKDYSKVFDLKLTGDAAKDQQAITEFFSGIGDEIAGKLVPNLAEFNKSGETLSATLQRLAGDFKGTDQVAQLLGFSADKLFGSTGLGSAGAREQLIDMAGGLSALNTQAAFFNQNFLTDAERIKPVAAALDKALASLGLATIPTTRDAFKGLVNDLITSGAAATESGAKQLDSLLALGEAFAQVHPYEAADKAQKAAAILQERQGLQDQLDELTLSSTGLLTKQRDALDESNRALFDQVQAVKAQASAIQAVKDSATSLLGGVDGAYSALQTVVNREKAAAQTSIDAHTAAFNKLQSLSQALRSTLDSLKSPDQKLAERALGQAQIRAALAIAKSGGPLPDADTLKNALSAVTQDASAQFGSYQDYLRDLYQTQNDISQLGDITDDSLSVEKQALDNAKEQLKSLDAQLASAQAQIDILKGIDTNGLSLIQAVEGVRTAILAAQGNPVVAATKGINQAYQSSLGRAPDAAGLAWWQNQAASGTSLSDITAAISGSAEAQIQKAYKDLLGGRTADAGGLQFFMNSGASVDAIRSAIMQSDEYKKLHPFAVGTNFVPETMPALIHQGERIIPAADNRALMARLSSPGQSNDVLVAEIKALRGEVKQLREANSAENRAIAKGAQEAAGHLDSAINGDTPLATKVIA